MDSDFDYIDNENCYSKVMTNIMINIGVIVFKTNICIFKNHTIRTIHVNVH